MYSAQQEGLLGNNERQMREGERVTLCDLSRRFPFLKSTFFFD